MKIERPSRKFIAEDLVIDSWEVIEGYYKDLLNREISTKESFENWLSDQSELDAILEEDMAWRYIRMTIDTTDESISEKYTFFVTEIQPKLAPIADQLNHKLMESPFLEEFNSDPAYMIMFRSVKTALDLYREENVAIQAKLSEESQEFGALSAAQTIEHAGKTLTMQKASLYLKKTDESIRREVFEKICTRRREDIDKFDELFDRLRDKRHQIARNAGFENFRDYKLRSMGRFDYSVQDCFKFHAAVKSTIVPLVKDFQLERLSLLGKDKFKPWDLDVDPLGRQPLKPFNTGAEMLEGSIRMFDKIDGYFGDCLRTMEEMKHLDLDSKQGKAPGGYNYPLYEIGVPFIFMNAVGAHRDLVTMVHEGGHAVHSFLSRKLKLTGFKNLPSEVAELASMSMELLSMDHWDELYHDSEELKRAKVEQLETMLKLLPWIAQVDEFQHWLYENHEHSTKDRTTKWMELNAEYGTGLVDYTGYEDIISSSWQRQLHIFEVPFYYIEYGIAQLGAIAVWKNSLENKDAAIQSYKQALSLGYTRSIPEIYSAAGIRFDFSEDYLNELASFIQGKIVKLYH